MWKKSELLSALLAEREIPHNLLNAKPENVEREAEIVAQAGRSGAVTIATNMAGRGTDIILGGNADYMARLKVREYLMPRIVKPEDDNAMMISVPGTKKPQQVPGLWGRRQQEGQDLESLSRYFSDGAVCRDGSDIEGNRRFCRGDLRRSQPARVGSGREGGDRGGKKPPPTIR